MSKKSIIKISCTALMTALIAVCSWISIPFPVPFTLQTFAIFLSLRLTGGKSGTASVVLYILLGAVGLPVFASGSAGIGYILGPTGGYITGFLVCCVLYTLLEGFATTHRRGAMLLALCSVSYYATGTVWYIISSSIPSDGILSAVALCTLPYIIPDTAKLLLSELLTKKLRRILKYDKSN